MGRYILADKIKGAKAVGRTAFIQEKCCNRRVLDLGCIRHDADSALKDKNWLHKKIKDVASEVVGVDYLPEEIRKLKASGYDIVFGDVTKPLDLAGNFDVIVAGDLIEHLTNFDGFFDNCKKLLAPSGILLISTANPFYSGEFHYLALRKEFLVNPEHTCWIDPQCLSQLCERFGFGIDELFFVKDSWNLGVVMCQTKREQYDILKDRWPNDTFASKLFRIVFSTIFNIGYAPYRFITGAGSALVKHSDYLAVLKIK